MTTSVVSDKKLNPVRVVLAWGVHLFTATGAIFGLLAILSIFEKDWKRMILWRVMAMMVEGSDGMLARWEGVKKYGNGIDGALFDNILDY